MAKARVRSITLGGKKFNINKDLVASGREVTKRINNGVFDAVRKNLRVKTKANNDLITQTSNSQVGAALRRGATKLRDNIARTRVFNALINESRLSRELGLTPRARRDKPVQMVNFVAEGLVARYSSNVLASNSSKQQVRFQILVPSMERITKNGFAKYTYRGVGPTTRGYQVEMRWLEWLLYEGSNIIIDGHAPMEGDPSRSQQETIMNSQPSAAYSWAVPLAYQGTEDDNFITKSYDKTLPSIRADFTRAIKKAIDDV